MSLSLGCGNSAQSEEKGAVFVSYRCAPSSTLATRKRLVFRIFTHTRGPINEEEQCEYGNKIHETKIQMVEWNSHCSRLYLPVLCTTRQKGISTVEMKSRGEYAFSLYLVR